MVEAITFDLWGTLIGETPESARKVKEARARNLFLLLQDQGYPGTIEEVEAASEQVGERLKAIWSRHEDVGPEGQVELLVEALEGAWKVPQDRMLLANLEWAYVSPVLKALPVLSPGAAELLDELRGQYRLGLICNTGRTPGTMLKIVLQRLGILDHFDALTFSDVLGVRKPDPQIFHQTLEQLKVSADRALHVGDDPSTDILGARGVGMWAVLIGSPGDSAPVDEGVRAVQALEELPGVLEQVKGQGE